MYVGTCLVEASEVGEGLGWCTQLMFGAVIDNVLLRGDMLQQAGLRARGGRFDAAWCSTETLEDRPGNVRGLHD